MKYGPGTCASNRIGTSYSTIQVCGILGHITAGQSQDMITSSAACALRVFRISAAWRPGQIMYWSIDAFYANATGQVTKAGMN